ncbi:MAG: hypothetical protein Q4F84_03070 [Fibrobacter sp.]|nr:hypothetical protein [Fibrobacter sp.]
MIFEKNDSENKALALLTFLFLLLIYKDSSCNENSFGKDVLDNMELSIRSRYKTCTRDSSFQTLNSLLSWKYSIDSLTGLPEYPDMLRKYQEETRVNPDSITPCDIKNWQERNLKEKAETDSVIQKHVDLSKKKKKNMALIQKSISDHKRSSLDFLEIPFGITKNTFHFLVKQTDLIIGHETEQYAALDSIFLGNYSYSCAFHFDADSNYYKYELESESFPLDSLDKKVRLIADNLIFYFRQKSGKPPDHSYRVGRFDIVSGRLSALAMWRINDTFVYIGLASHKYNYYAKAIVWKEKTNSKPIDK